MKVKSGPKRRTNENNIVETSNVINPPMFLLSTCFKTKLCLTILLAIVIKKQSKRSDNNETGENKIFVILIVFNNKDKLKLIIHKNMINKVLPSRSSFYFPKDKFKFEKGSPSKFSIT